MLQELVWIAVLGCQVQWAAQQQHQVEEEECRYTCQRERRRTPRQKTRKTPTVMSQFSFLPEDDQHRQVRDVTLNVLDIFGEQPEDIPSGISLGRHEPIFPGSGGNTHV